MNNLLLRFFLITLFLFSCKQKTNDDTAISKSDQSSSLITESDISKLKLLEYELDIKTENLIQSWEQYNELVSVISTRKRKLIVF